MRNRLSKHNCAARKHRQALQEICKIFVKWSKGQLPVAINDKVADRTAGYAVSLDDMLAQIRNIVLAALDEDELVPGMPDQHYPVLMESDLS